MAKRTSCAAAQQARAALEGCSRPLICSHIRLDGDAVGAEVGLFHILRDMGKDPEIVNDGAVPSAYMFLCSGLRVGSKPGDISRDRDLVVALDAPNTERLGSLAEKLPPGVTRVNIDHHAGNDKYADVNWVDAGYSSVGEMIAELTDDAGWMVSPQAATALYVAIVTDTNRFSYPNTNADTLRVAARLIERGAEHVAVAERFYFGEPFGIARLRGLCLEGTRLVVGGRAAVTRLTREMFEATSTRSEDTHEFAEIPRAIEGVVAGVLLREMHDGSIKVSLRSRAGFDVETIARKFGGGGHREAAGCVIDGSMDQVEATVVGELARAIEEKHG